MGTPVFPGLYCPGLIEVMCLPRASCTSPWFPGLYCPGLIEVAGFVRAAPVTCRCFRGSIAPASLKCDEAQTLLLDTTAFPGLYCPGLIEVSESRSP